MLRCNQPTYVPSGTELIFVAEKVLFSNHLLLKKQYGRQFVTKLHQNIKSP